MEYPTEDLQLHAAGVVQHGWPVHRQPHFLAALESVLGGEPHFATADFERFAYTNGEDPATLHALVADVLLYGKPAPRAPPTAPAEKVFHGSHWKPGLPPYGDRLRSAQIREIPMAATTTTGHQEDTPQRLLSQT